MPIQPLSEELTTGTHCRTFSTECVRWLLIEQFRNVALGVGSSWRSTMSQMVLSKNITCTGWARVMLAWYPFLLAMLRSLSQLPKSSNHYNLSYFSHSLTTGYMDTKCVLKVLKWMVASSRSLWNAVYSIWLYVVFSEDTHLFVQSPYSIYIVLLRYMEQHTFKHLMLCTVYISLWWNCWIYVVHVKCGVSSFIQLWEMCISPYVR